MSSTSSSDSFEDFISRVFNDLEPISFSLLMELDSFVETHVNFQRYLALVTNTTPDKTNIATLAEAKGEESFEVAKEECQSNIPEMPSETPNETNMATLAGAMGEEALEVAEEECQSNIPEMPSETPNETNIATLAATKAKMSSTLSSDSFEDFISRVFNDPEPISFSLLMELDSFAETHVSFQRYLALVTNTTPDKTNIATFAEAMSEGAFEVAEKECQSNIPKVSSETPNETNVATLAGAMGEEALEVAEEECQSNIPKMPSETPMKLT
ncbi:hypothetical protein MRB53_013513 [Persea americana]|uniref:Uncharacterized protein n=1 Tax=Persea americana TaxID=3435 RepID=A0ACC2K8N3_PERAE|nr:hypothetical protein MRB53_013513 [Persea americana]